MVALVARTVFDLLGERSAPGHKIKPVISTKVKEPANRTRRPRRVILAVSLQRRGKNVVNILLERGPFYDKRPHRYHARRGYCKGFTPFHR